MKKAIILLTILLIATSYSLQSQSAKPVSTEDRPEIIRDRLLIDVFHSFWMGMPKEVNSSKLNPGFNIAFLWDFKKDPHKPFSFGLGVGVTYYTQFSDAVLKQDTKDDVMRYFVLPYDTMAKWNRLSYVNCNIPLEFRYRHKSGFKVSLGVRVGVVAEISHFYKGNSPDGSGEQIHRKSFEIYNKQKFNFDVYIRAGWKYVSIYYGYQINSLFESGKGPQIMPMSLGITWNLF